MAWIVVYTALLISVLCAAVNSLAEQHGAVSPGLVDMGCSIETLTQDILVDRCFGSDDTPIRHFELKLVPLATVCTIKCKNHKGISYRVCDIEGYWTGPQLRCTAEDTTSEQEKKRVRRWGVRFRRIFRRVKNVLKKVHTYVHCALFGCRRPHPADNKSPSLICPADIHKTADAFQDSTRIYWTEPDAYDDRDGTIKASRQSWRRPGLRYSDGMTTVGYDVRDNAGNYASCSFKIHISVIRCSTPIRIKHGYFVCRPSHDYRYGGWCRYGCYRGYELNGDSHMECRKSGDWSQGTPSCEKVRCPRLDRQAHAMIQCSDWNYFQSKCSYLCNDGFRVPAGQNSIQVCGYNRRWRGGIPVCRDYERPQMYYCPINRIAYTAKLSDFGLANWTEPYVVDNSGERIRATRTGPAPNTPLTVGTHRVTYNARDSAGNKAFPCSFTVNVRRLVCPVIYATPYQRVSCPAGHGYGASCDFNCTGGMDLKGKQTVSCEAHGYPPVTHWTWDSTQPICTGLQCPQLDPPVNGALACDYWLYGQFCQMFCQKGMDVAKWMKGRIPELLVCSTEGAWSSIAFEDGKLPPCKKTRRPKDFRLMTSAQYYSDECCANDTQRRISEVFIAALSSPAYSSVCYPQSCRVDNVNVRCNPPCDETGRRKRSESVAIVDVSLTVAAKASMSAKENYATATATMRQLEDVLQYSATNTTYDLDIQFKSVDRRKPIIVCGDDLLPSMASLSCVSCGPGHYVNQTLSICQPCPLGSYLEDEEATICSICPPGTCTRTVGTEGRDECLPKCAPGSYSVTGVEPCIPCELGTFTDKEATVQCRPCPPGTSTADEGASQLAHCKAFDIVFVPTDYQQYVSMTTSVTAELQELSLTLKVRLAEHQNGSEWGEVLRMDRVVNYTAATENILRVVIATANEIHVVVEACGCNVSSSVAATTLWHSIGVSVNETTLLLHHNGHQLVTSGSCVGSESYDNGDNITAALRVTIGNSTDDAFCGEVADVNVWDKTLNSKEFESALTSCGHAAQGNIVSWRDMSMAELIGTSIQIPSLCDVTDDCASAPCGNHTCIDALRGYDCECDDGFTGRHCQVNIDDCQDNACENNATCVDAVTTYTCLCPDSFYGNFCEHEIVNGAWGEWGDWSQCSRSCGGGNSTRRRLCDSPPPDTDGRPCDGDSEEGQACHTDECPVCGELESPDHGSVNCTDDESINCTAACDDGYEFSIEPLPYYYCGPDTANRWSHQTEDNPHARVPDCAELSPPLRLTINHTVQYVDAPCDAANIVTEARTRTLETVIHVPCIKNSTCVMSELSVTCNDTEHNRRRQRRDAAPLLTVSVLLSISGDDGDTANYTNEYDVSDELDAAVRDLETAAKVLEARADDGNFTLFVDGMEYIIEKQNITGVVDCAPGMTRVSTLCVACSRGTHSSDDVCVKCPYGLYQDEPQQTSCKPCPDGFTTPGTGAKYQQECSVGCSSGEYIKDHVCVKCPVGFYQDLPAQASCKGCPDGYTTHDVGTMNANECNVGCSTGQYSQDHVCVKCPVGFYQDLPAQASCEGCPDGYTTHDVGMVNANECNVTCTAGTYSKKHVCEKCPVGFYQDLEAQASCKGCPEGFTTRDVGLVHVSECNVTCTAGAYIKDHACEKCPVGFYQDLPAQASCKGCPDGYTTSEVGTVNANECNVAVTTSRDGGQLLGMGTVKVIVSCVAVCVVVALGIVAIYTIYHKKHISVVPNSKRCDTPGRPPTRVAWT